MEERIDYVKLNWAANNIDAADVLRTRYEDMWSSYQATGVQKNGTFDFNRAYDGKGNWRYTVDVSGPAADDFFSVWLNPLTDFQYISRVDYRVELGQSLPDGAHDTLYNNVRALNSRNRNVTRGHARHRNKGPKRDGGGNRVSVGSLTSDRYFAVYTKPGELTAIEIKLSGARLANLKQSATSAARATGGGSGALIERWRMALRNAHARYCQEVTGLLPGEMFDALAGHDNQVTEMPEGNLAHHVSSGFEELPRVEQLRLFEEWGKSLFPESW